MAGAAGAFHVVLVVILGRPELGAFDHLGDDRLPAEALRSGELGDVLLGGLRLLGRAAEDGRAVLVAHVRTLAVELRGVVDHEKPFQQLAVGDLRRVERHLHHFCVAGTVVAHVLVGGRVGGAAHVAALGARHAGADLEPVLGAPEAAAGEVRGHGGGGHGGVLLRRIGARGCGGLAARQAGRVLGERVGGQRALVVELERGGVEAVAQAGGLRAVLEDVAEVRAAAGAVDLVAHHAVAVVALRADVHRVDGGVEAGPAGARVELVLAREERQAAHDARVRALLVVVQEVPAERGLGARVLGDAVGLRRELRRQLLHRGRRERGHVVAGLRSGGSGCGLGVHGSGALFGRGAGDEDGAGERDERGDGETVHVHGRLRVGSVGRHGPARPRGA